VPEQESREESERVEQVPVDLTRMFEFTQLEQVERLAHILDGYYTGCNDLYKNEHKNRYYLVVHKNQHSPEEFNRVCNIICEYAVQKNYNAAVGAYFAEHGRKITGPRALQVLAAL
jgi:adapter protein MecA 1/2